MDLKSKITSLVEAALENDSFFIVDINVAGSEEGTKKISILVDCDSSITIDQCASISRQIASKIEEYELISTAFLLEVSSPGLDRPLSLLRQYQKNMGKRVEITTIDNKVRIGKIQNLSVENITLDEEVPNKANKKKIDILPVIIPFKEIKKTIKVISFK
ncbi:MAG: ribosome maturation factor RimP [Cytophagales bacterium]|nr:MAG: ribosome maturation factor RimP [Cytophagales bacterium]